MRHTLLTRCLRHPRLALACLNFEIILDIRKASRAKQYRQNVNMHVFTHLRKELARVVLNRVSDMNSIEQLMTGSQTMKTTAQVFISHEQPSLTSAQVMIAIAIMGLLAAIAMPYFVMA
jgi:hypothetical protein